MSNSATECPEPSGLYSTSGTSYTTKWDGQGSGPNDGSRSTHSVDSDHCPPGASPYRSLVWQYWWE